MSSEGIYMDKKNNKFALDIIRDVLQKEANAVLHIVGTIDQAYLDALALIMDSDGKVVLTGMGKSGLVARKIAATMSSTGTLAVFMHPAEAAHGDLGIVQKDDVVIALGKSGESNELNEVLPVIKKLGAKIIAITANSQSTLAKYADAVLDGGVAEEACPYDLAPTTSTTVSMAIGDALAIALMKLNDFQPNDFALYHPGGRLGRRLLLQVRDVMVAIDQCPVLKPSESTVKDLIVALSQYGLGIVLFSEGGGGLDGILTDGDVRRLLDAHGPDIFSLSISDVLIRAPTVVSQEAMAVQALKVMEERDSPLNVLPVVDDGRCHGIIRLHELLQVV